MQEAAMSLPKSWIQPAAALSQGGHKGMKLQVEDMSEVLDGKGTGLSQGEGQDSGHILEIWRSGPFF